MNTVRRDRSVLGGILRNVFTTEIGERDALALMAFLPECRIRLRVEALKEGLSGLEWHLTRSDATHVLAAVWEGRHSAEKRSYLYWHSLWNERLGSTRAFFEDPTRRASYIALTARRLERHPLVESVKCEGAPSGGGPFTALSPEQFGEIRWHWDLDLRELPLRASVAIAARSARRQICYSACWAMLRGRMEMLDHWRRSLRAIESFALGRPPIEEWLAKEPTLLPDLRNTQHFATQNLTSSTNEGDAAAGWGTCALFHAQSSVHLAIRFLRQGRQCELDGCLDSIQYGIVDHDAAMRDFGVLLGLKLGEYPELGAGVDVRATGPLGPLRPSKETEAYREGLAILGLA